MASKKQKTAASSSGSFNHSKFISKAAEERYTSALIKKRAVAERGIRDSVPDGPIALLIERHKWTNFVQEPEAGVVPLVREFYANAKEHRNFKVFVRGKQVSFDRKSINQYYGLPNYPEDEYCHYWTNALDYDEVIQKVAVTGAKWIESKGKPYRILTQDLDEYSRAWHMFIAGKLMPVTHVSDITLPRAVLLFAILEGKSIDVGKIIEESILHVLSGTTSGGLAHPSLITGLCKKVGVKWDQLEELVHPTTLATVDSSNAFKRPSKASGRPRARTRPPAEVASSSTRRRDKLDIFIDYQVQYNEAMARQMAQLALSSGQELVQFPPAPTFEDDDDEGDGMDDDES